MEKFKIGTILRIRGMECRVVSSITYTNPQDNNKSWTEYRLNTPQGEQWLSVDDIYKEYSMSHPTKLKKNQIGPEWHKVDGGIQVVRSFEGHVDVETGDRAEFAEFEDASEDNTLSLEIWDDGTEISQGYYIEAGDIQRIGFEEPKTSKAASIFKLIFLSIVILILSSGVKGIYREIRGENNKISNYLSHSSKYDYETSITGDEKQKADVYELDSFEYPTTTALVVEDIIKNIDGETESITQSDEDDSVTILTKREFCLVYVSEDGDEDGDGYDDIYVQISGRKYNYTSDNSPYHASRVTSRWYRNSYYSRGYDSDASKWSRTPSAYETYQGTIVQDMGNGYFDAYSSSVRQASIKARQSDSGGISSGK